MSKKRNRKLGFKLQSVSSIIMTVEFDIPTNAGEEQQRGDLDVTFRRRSVKEQRDFLTELRERTKDKTIDDLLDTDEDNDESTLMADVMNVDGMVDESGEPVEFDQVVFKQLLQIDFVRAAILEQWQELNFGAELVKRLKEKN